MSEKISAAVGKNAANRPEDVKTIQRMLNAVTPDRGGPETPLAIDGYAWGKTVAAIERFQKLGCGFKWPDGCVDPDGKTFVKLSQSQSVGEQPGPREEEKCCYGSSQAIDEVKAMVASSGSEAQAAGNLLGSPGWPKSLPRPLNRHERGVMTSVFGSSLDPATIFLIEKKPPKAQGMVLAGLPPSLVATYILIEPGFSDELLAHELTHCWQSQHHPDPLAFMTNAALSHAMAVSLTKATGRKHDPYKYSAGHAFGGYAAEQIAEQVEDGVTAIVSHVGSVFLRLPDPANIASLAIPRAEPV